MQRAPKFRLIAMAGTAALVAVVPLAAATAGPADIRAPGAPPKSTPEAPPPATGRTVRCGPELTSAQRIEARTCVLAERGRTRARTYYRNPSGDPLRAVLTLLRPDGTTVQVHCALPAADEPGVCETPDGPTVHRDGVPYGAVAEISDAAQERLLLRSGGNSA